MSDKTDIDLSPLVFTVTVPRSVDDAFLLFTEKIGTWWPESDTLDRRGPRRRRDLRRT